MPRRCRRPIRPCGRPAPASDWPSSHSAASGVAGSARSSPTVARANAGRRRKKAFARHARRVAKAACRRRRVRRSCTGNWCIGACTGEFVRCCSPENGLAGLLCGGAPVVCTCLQAAQRPRGVPVVTDVGAPSRRPGGINARRLPALLRGASEIHQSSDPEGSGVAAASPWAAARTRWPEPCGRSCRWGCAAGGLAHD
jgi:hypothetical protein